MDKEESIWSKLVDVITIMDAKMSHIQADIRGIKKDLKNHMRRTELNETAVERLQLLVEKVGVDLLKFKIVGGLIVTIGLGLAGLMGWLIKLLIDLKGAGIL